MQNYSRPLRGGSWYNQFPYDTFTYSFRCYLPYDQCTTQGFRCVYLVNGTPTTDARLLQGGAWYDDEAYGFRTHYHSRNTPDYWNALQGVRCVYPTVEGN